MTRSATTSCSPSSWGDLDARRSHWSSVAWTSRPIVIRFASDICAERSSCRARVTAVSILLRTARELGGHGHMNGRACSFVVRVRYACVQYSYGAWAAYSLLGGVYGQS